MKKELKYTSPSKLDGGKINYAVLDEVGAYCFKGETESRKLQVLGTIDTKTENTEEKMKQLFKKYKQ